MQAALSLVPVSLILVVMVGLRWPAARAGVLGLAVTVPIALLAFGYGGGGAEGPSLAVAGALAEAAFIAATVLWIIFPALCIYELQLAGGAFETLKRALVRISDDRRVLAILVAWFFALFLEGAAGFGTPVALAAPVLVGLGFPPLRALAVVLVAHSVGVSFGAVGTPVVPQMAATGLPGLALAEATGLLHALLGWIILAFAVRLARSKGASGGPSAVVLTALAAASFLLPFIAIAWFVGPELPTLGGALIGGVLFVLALKRIAPPPPDAGGERIGAASLARAALPYLVLLALILLTRLVPPLAEALRSVEIAWTWQAEFAGAMAPLYHPGTLLVLGFLVGGLLQGRSGRDLAAAAGKAARRLPPVLVALVAMLGLARLMVHAGMVDTLAEAAAAGLGPVWPLAAPLVGVLGTFVTGSATASNILFTDFQAATATALGLPVLWMAAAQGFGAAVGNMVCPHNIVPGAATVGLAGREGETLRLTIVPCLTYALAGGVLVFVLVS